MKVCGKQRGKTHEEAMNRHTLTCHGEIFQLQPQKKAALVGFSSSQLSLGQTEAVS